MSGKEISIPGTQEVIEKVTKIAAEDADDLAVMQYLMQASANAQLIRMRKLEEAKIPAGTLKLLRFTVGTQVFSQALYPPWISFTAINDGLGTVNIWINTTEDPLIDQGMIQAGDPLNVNMDYPIIWGISVKAIAGTATIRIYGKEGIPSPLFSPRL